MNFRTDCQCPETCEHVNSILSQYATETGGTETNLHLMIRSFLEMQEEFILYKCDREVPLSVLARLQAIDLDVVIPAGVDGTMSSVFDLDMDQALLQKVYDIVTFQTSATLADITATIAEVEPTWNVDGWGDDNGTPTLDVSNVGTDATSNYIVLEHLALPMGVVPRILQ